MLLILLLYFAKGRNMTLAILAADSLLVYGSGLFNDLVMLRSLMYFKDTMMLCFSLLPLILVYLYNGERGKAAKWAFYWAYPLHITVLAILRWALLA